MDFFLSLKENKNSEFKTSKKLDILLLAVLAINIAVQSFLVCFTKIYFDTFSQLFCSVMPFFLAVWFYCCHKNGIKISPYILTLGIVLGGVCYCWYGAVHFDAVLTRNSIFVSTIICWGIFFYFLYFYVFSLKKGPFLLFAAKCISGEIILFPLICFYSFNLADLQHALLMNSHEIISFSINPEVFRIFCLPIVCRFLLQSAFVLICSAGICSAIPQISAPQILKKFCISGMVLSILFAIPMSVQTFRFLRLLNEEKCIKKMAFFQRDVKCRVNPIHAMKLNVHCNTVPGMYFLIAGESHNYQRPKRPYPNYRSLIDKIDKDKNFTVFHNAYCLPVEAGEIYTGHSEFERLNMLAYPKTRVAPLQLLELPLLLDFCHYSHIKTFWVSNLGSLAAFAQIQKFFADSCDVTLVTTENSYGKKYAGKGLQVDTEIVPYLKKLYQDNIFDKKGSFMLLQPLGAHIGQLQIPETFQKKFSSYTKDERELGELYYDQILEKIIATLISFPETMAIVYVSDHTWERNRNNLHITMFIYLSPELQRRYPALLPLIKQYAGRDFINSEICQLYLKILNIELGRKEKIVIK